MEAVPAISRHLKLYSTWIAVAAGTFDILYLALDTLKDQLDPHWFAIINASLIALIKIATLVKQNVPVTEAQKQDLVESAVATPLKPSKE